MDNLVLGVLAWGYPFRERKRRFSGFTLASHRGSLSFLLLILDDSNWCSGNDLEMVDFLDKGAPRRDSLLDRGWIQLYVCSRCMEFVDMDV